MKKKLIVFKVECNSKIGFGHLKRSITYAQSLIDQNTKIFFLLNNNNLVKQIIRHYNIKNFYFDNLHSLIILRKLSKKYQKYKQILIFDSYKVSQEMINNSKSLFKKVGYIDDLGLNFNSDFVINYSIEKDKYKYLAKKKFLGKKYIPLPRDNLKSKKVKKIKKILITFGAMDHYNLTINIFKWFLKNYENKKFIVIIGPYYKDKEKLKKFFSKYSNTEIYISPLNILKILKKTDLVICAGGHTVYEALYFNKLVLSIQLWNNQNNTGRDLNLHNLEIIKYSKNKMFFMRNFKLALLNLVNNLAKGIIYKKKFKKYPENFKKGIFEVMNKEVLLKKKILIKE